MLEIWKLLSCMDRLAINVCSVCKLWTETKRIAGILMWKPKAIAKNKRDVCKLKIYNTNNYAYT